VQQNGSFNPQRRHNRVNVVADCMFPPGWCHTTLPPWKYTPSAMQPFVKILGPLV